MERLTETVLLLLGPVYLHLVPFYFQTSQFRVCLLSIFTLLETDERKVLLELGIELYEEAQDRAVLLRIRSQEVGQLGHIHASREILEVDVGLVLLPLSIRCKGCHRNSPTLNLHPLTLRLGKTLVPPSLVHERYVAVVEGGTLLVLGQLTAEDRGILLKVTP